jgi:hypothetical protein
MKQKKYTFERVDGGSDYVELHRKGQHFHFFAKFLCLLLAVVFWLLVVALGDIQANDQTGKDLSTEQQTQIVDL